MDKQTKERPILFNAEMVRAILDGSKIQTRRAVPDWQLPVHDKEAESKGDGRVCYVSKMYRRKDLDHAHIGGTSEADWAEKIAQHYCGLCPTGSVGDLLWVRESTKEDEDTSDTTTLSKYCADDKSVLYSGCDDEEYNGSIAHWDYPRRVRPSIHMQRWACRILLEITSVRVERLNDISEADALAEGIVEEYGIVGCNCNGGEHNEEMGTQFFSPNQEDPFEDPVQAYEALWNSIYQNWDENPFVWVIEFKIVEGK